jgi:hypothetical protein
MLIDFTVSQLEPKSQGTKEQRSTSALTRKVYNLPTSFDSFENTNVAEDPGHKERSRQLPSNPAKIMDPSTNSKDPIPESRPFESINFSQGTLFIIFEINYSQYSTTESFPTETFRMSLVMEGSKQVAVFHSCPHLAQGSTPPIEANK